MRAKIVLLMAAATGIATVTGCAGPARSGVGSLGSVRPAVSTPASSVATTALPTTAPATTPAATVLPCTAGDLSVQQLPGDSGAAGTIVIAIRVTNSSAGTCSVRGFPAFTLTAHSSSMATDIDEPVTLAHGNFAGPVFGAAVSTVDLAPGARAAFLVAYSQIHSDGTGGCDVANKMHLTLPGDTGEAVGDVQIPVCGAPMQISPYLPAAKVTL